MPLFGQLPDGWFADEDQKNEESANHVQTSNDAKEGLENSKKFHSIRVYVICVSSTYVRCLNLEEEEFEVYLKS
jgi:hypothetical protein